MGEEMLSRIGVEKANSLPRGTSMKRAFDLAVSIVALLTLAPLLALIAIAIKRESPGPVIYRGDRVGLHGRVFKILKFRTMYETPESYSGPKVTAHDDPRVTPLGRWLRNTKLNELLQFWNVVLGDMSLVGPRPEDPALVENWPKAARDEILSVRPGITSPTSVIYRNEEALLCAQDVFWKYVREVGPDKLRLDQMYVRYRSPCLDIDTILWTLLILLPMIRSHEPPERLLFVGPVTRFVRRYVSWFLIDLLVSLVAVGCTGIAWRSFSPLHVGWPGAIAAALVFALLFSAISAVMGVNRIDWSRAAPADIWDLIVAWIVAAIVALAASLASQALPFGLVAVASLASFLGFVAVRYRSRLATGLVSYIMLKRARRCDDRENVLIIGSSPNSQYAASILGRPGNAQRLRVCGFVDDDLHAQGLRVGGTHVIGTLTDIPDLIAKHEVKVVLLADQAAAGNRCHALAAECHRAGARLVFMPDPGDSLGDLCNGRPVRSTMGDLSLIGGLSFRAGKNASAGEARPDDVETWQVLDLS